jgi:hypothetical protein
MTVTSLQVYKAMQKLCEYGIEEQEAEHITLSIFKIKEDYTNHLNRQGISGKLSTDLEVLKKELKSLRKDIVQLSPVSASKEELKASQIQSMTFVSIFIIASSPMLFGIMRLIAG